MALYDDLGAASQLGGDLQLWSSGSLGFFSGLAARWDRQPSTSSFFARPPDVDTFVDACFHEGKLHVVWVEPKLDGSLYAAGPYVKRYDGPGWTQLGGPVDDSATAETVVVSDYEPALAVDDRGYPSRVRIVSDGVDLYVAYAIHVGAVADDPPPLGSYFPGDPYGHVVAPGEHQSWSARHIYVRRWDGADWEEYGHIPPIVNNSMTSGQNMSSTNHGLDRFGQIGLACNPDDPGVVFVSFTESGQEGTGATYTLSPHFFVGFTFGTSYYPYYHGRLSITRFDGSDTVGETKDIVRLDSISHYRAAGDHLAVGPLVVATAVDDFFTPHKILALAGDCYIAWSTPHDEFPVKLARFSDTPVTTMIGPVNGEYANETRMPILDTLDDFGPVLTNIAYSVSRERGDVVIGNNPREITPDTFDYLDGDPTVAGANTYRDGNGDAVSLAVDDPDNLWAIAAAHHVYHYHRPCQAWTPKDTRLPGSQPATPFGNPVLILEQGLFSGEGPAFYDDAYAHNSEFAVAGPYQTDIDAGDETNFRTWVALNLVPFDPDADPVDYDMRGYWLDFIKPGGIWNPGDHFPDTWKTPYDTTFSNESVYATEDCPFEWDGDRLIDTRDGSIVFGTGDTLYIANAYRNASSNNDFRVRILEVPILRDELSCGEPGAQGVFLHARKVQLSNVLVALE